MEILAAQLIELGVSQGPEAPPRPNRQHKGPAASSTSNSVQSASGNDQNNKQMPQSSSILDQVSDWNRVRSRLIFQQQNSLMPASLFLHCYIISFVSLSSYCVRHINIALRLVWGKKKVHNIDINVTRTNSKHSKDKSFCPSRLYRLKVTVMTISRMLVGTI